MAKIDMKKFLETVDMIASETADKTMASLRAEGFKYQVGNDKLYDVCGFAIVKFRDERCSLARQLKKYLTTKGLSYSGNIPFDVSRQEMTVNREVAKAICQYVNENFATADKPIVNVICWVD